MIVNNKLILLARDYGRGTMNVFSTEKYLVVLPNIEHTSTGSNLSKLINTYLKIDINWINPKVLTIKQPKGDVLDVYYYAQIPIDTPIIDGRWIGIDNVQYFTDYNVRDLIIWARDK